MKKIAPLLMALVFLGAMAAGIKAGEAKGAMCPKCNIQLDTGTKPVIGQLEGKKHTCPACGKEYEMASGKTVHEFTACGGLVEECPACGKTELTTKA